MADLFHIWHYSGDDLALALAGVRGGSGRKQRGSMMVEPMKKLPTLKTSETPALARLPGESARYAPAFLSIDLGKR